MMSVPAAIACLSSLLLAGSPADGGRRAEGTARLTFLSGPDSPCGGEFGQGLALVGAEPSGTPVTLLSESSDETCAARTGDVVRTPGGDDACTRLELAEPCRTQFVPVAVVGAHARYRRLALERIKDERTLAEISQAVARSRVVATLVETEQPKRKKAAKVLETELFAAYQLGDVESPLVAWYRVRFAGPREPEMREPVLLVENGIPAARFGACSSRPWGFALGDVRYLWVTSGCCDCDALGARLDAIYVIEHGRAKPLLETTVLSD